MIGAFTEPQISAFRELRLLWPNARLVLVGASALAVHEHMRWRKTDDLDLSISIPVGDFQAGLDSRPAWRRHAVKEHEFISPSGVKVDLLPVGPEQLARRELVWPSGFKMNLTGFRLVFSEAVPLDLAPGLQIQVAPLPVIALLKMVAWLDRPAERQRDLADLAHLLDEFVDPHDDAFFGPEVTEQQVDYEQVSAYLLGREVGKLVDDDERALVERFIERLLTDEGLRALMARLGPRSWDGDAVALVPRVEAFRRGFRASLRPRSSPSGAS